MKQSSLGGSTDDKVNDAVKATKDILSQAKSDLEQKCIKYPEFEVHLAQMRKLQQKQSDLHKTTTDFPSTEESVKREAPLSQGYQT